MPHVRSQLLCLVSLVLVVAGCSPTAPAPDREEESLPKVTHQRAESPRDRDPQAVLAALRRLDPCALIDPAKAAVPGYPASLTPIAAGPHRCEVYRTYGDDEIEVIVGAPFNAERRFDAEQVSIGGAKAYQRTSSDTCTVWLPVSFELAIRLWAREGVYSTGNGDLCGPARGFATYMVEALGRADAAPTPWPMGGWDACQVLTAAMDSKPMGYRFAVNDDLYGIDGCGGDLENPQAAAPALVAHLMYNPDPARERDSVRTIDGHAVRVYEQPGQYCHLTWSVGKVTTAHPSSTDQLIELHAPDCVMGEAMVRATMRWVAHPPTMSEPVPLHPLTYRPDEPDIGVAGPCVDFTWVDDPAMCQPAVDVRVPTEPRQLMRAAEADPHVICAMTRDAVTKHVSAHLTPVVSGSQCVFVEPTHAVRLHVRISVDGRPQVGDGERGLAIAGHTAVAGERIDDKTARYRLDVAAFPSPSGNSSGGASGRTDPGVVSFSLELTRPRGTSSEDVAAIDTRPAATLTPAVTDIVTASFAGR